MLLDFIKITSEVISKEIPYLLTTNVNYRCEEGAMTINIRFYDTNFKIRGFEFTHYEAPNAFTQYEVPSDLNVNNDLALEFAHYLRKYVKPIFKNK